MAKEMIFLVEQIDSTEYKATNINFSIKVTAKSYDEIKRNVEKEVMKLDNIVRPETIRYRFVKEESYNI